MTRLSQFLTLCLFASAMIFLGCNNSDDDGITNCNWTLELQAESDALAAASAAYGNDPTTQNCEAWRAAYQSYLNAAADLDGCVVGTERQAYLQAIADAQAQLDNISC